MATEQFFSKIKIMIVHLSWSEFHKLIYFHLGILPSLLSVLPISELIMTQQSLNDLEHFFNIWLGVNSLNLEKFIFSKQI